MAAFRRDYHTLLFDGLGQCDMLCEQGLPARLGSGGPCCGDFARTSPLVDSSRIAPYSWSIGERLAHRVASGYPMAFEIFADVVEHLPRLIGEIYNDRTLHSPLGCRSPAPCEDQFAQKTVKEVA